MNVLHLRRYAWLMTVLALCAVAAPMNRRQSERRSLSDTSAPVLSEFDFTPKTVDVAAGSKTLTVTARVTDASGTNAPTMLIGSDTTTQSAASAA